jgi:hypothetical protein
MAKSMKGRAENDIKNKWYSMQRKEKRLEGLRVQEDEYSEDDDEVPDSMLSVDAVDYFATAGFSHGKNAADLKTEFTFV